MRKQFNFIKNKINSDNPSKNIIEEDLFEENEEDPNFEKDRALNKGLKEMNINLKEMNINPKEMTFNPKEMNINPKKMIFNQKFISLHKIFFD
jgi:hypothetical protein